VVLIGDFLGYERVIISMALFYFFLLPGEYIDFACLITCSLSSVIVLVCCFKYNGT
jgi:hypothetical protein